MTPKQREETRELAEQRRGSLPHADMEANFPARAYACQCAFRLAGAGTGAGDLGLPLPGWRRDKQGSTPARGRGLLPDVRWGQSSESPRNDSWGIPAGSHRKVRPVDTVHAAADRTLRPSARRPKSHESLRKTAMKAAPSGSERARPTTPRSGVDGAFVLSTRGACQ